MTLFHRATSLASLRVALPACRAAWRLSMTAWHIARGVYIVSAVFPRLDAAQKRAWTQRWSRAVLRDLGVSLHAQGHAQARAQLLVANHVSWLDVIVLQALFPHARFVSKAAVRHWPLIGRLAIGARTIFVERDRPRRTGQSVDAIAAALAAGETVVVFPEGTTSDGHTVLPFQASLLQAALLTAVPVRPVALRYADAQHAVSPTAPYIADDTLIGSMWRTARADALVAHVHVLDTDAPMPPSRRALAVALRSAIQTALDADPRAHADERRNAPAFAACDGQTTMPSTDA